MNRIVITTQTGSDGSLHLDLPPGSTASNVNVQVTVEPVQGRTKSTPLATDLLNSDLIGIWAGREDIGDNHEFARRLREEAQRRGRAS